MKLRAGKHYPENIRSDTVTMGEREEQGRGASPGQGGGRGALDGDLREVEG